MADPTEPRVVTGEILPADTASPRSPRAAAVDAEFVTVAPPETPAPQPSRIVADAPPLDGMGALRGDALAAPQAAGSRRAGPPFWAAGFLVALLAFWFAGGHSLMPGFEKAPPPPAPALAIEAVASRVDASGPKPLLFVDGSVVNGGTAAGVAPKLAIDVAGNDGRVTRYILSTGSAPLQPGAEFPFSSRLDVPKSGVKTVSVTFVDEE